MSTRLVSADWDEVDENTLIADCWLDFLSTRDFASAGPAHVLPCAAPSDSGERDATGCADDR